MKINVSIVDDHPIVLNGLTKMLSGKDDIEVIRVYNDGKSLLNGLRQIQPDVLILDLEMPDYKGEDLARTVSRQYPKIAILVLTNRDQPYYLNLLLKNGAKGYLLKNTGIQTLIEAIIAVSKGEQYLDASFRKEEGRNEENDKKVPIITKREIQVLELIADGLTSNEIAKELFITLSTVENHRINLFLKFEVKNSVALVRKGLELGIIK